MVGRATDHTDRERGLERQPCGRDGRERPASNLPGELAAGGSVFRAGSPPRFFGKGVMTELVRYDAMCRAQYIAGLDSTRF